VAARLESLRALEPLSRLAEMGDPTWTEGLDTLDLNVEGPLADLEWAQVEAAAGLGVRLNLRIQDADTGELVIETTAGSAFAVAVRGEFDQSLGGDDLAQLREACKVSRPDAIVALLQSTGQAVCRLWAAFENKPLETGFRWIRSRDRLLAELASPATAVAFARRLAATPQVRHLVVENGATTLVRTLIVVVHGPNEWPSEPGQDWMDDLASAYADTFQAQWADRRLPSPVAFAPIANATPDVDTTTAFTKLSSLLAWSWMSVDSKTLRFDGVRTVQFDPFFPDPANLDASLTLWRWAVSSPAMDRHEALQRAITLSLFAPKDVDQAPSILKNARWFLDLSQRDAVAEALTTRRQVREAALSTSARVASTAADATIKAFDRVAVQIAAAVGIIFAQYKNLLDPVPAARLLAAMVGLLLLSSYVSVGLDFRFIAQGLRAFRQDLQVYREILSSEDISEVSELKSLTSARRQNRRRWIASGVLHGVAVLAIVAAMGLMLHGQFREVWP